MGFVRNMTNYLFSDRQSTVPQNSAHAAQPHADAYSGRSAGKYPSGGFFRNLGNYASNAMDRLKSFAPSSTPRHYRRLGIITALAVASTACPFCPDKKNGDNGGTTPTKTYTITLNVLDTFTKTPIGRFTYNICGNGEKQAQGNQIQGTMSGKGTCTVAARGGELEIPRDHTFPVEGDVNMDVLAIRAGTNFPVEHYRAIVPIFDGSIGTIRFGTDNLSVYAVEHDRSGQVQRVTPVIKELYERLNPTYKGIVPSMPSSNSATLVSEQTVDGWRYRTFELPADRPSLLSFFSPQTAQQTASDGDIYVNTVDWIDDRNGGSLSGTADYFFIAGTQLLKYVGVRLVPHALDDVAAHETAYRAICFRGNGPPGTIGSNTLPRLPPDPDTKKAAELVYNRGWGHFLSPTADRDVKR